MKKPVLHVKIHYPGSVLEGDFDFDAVVKLKDKYLKFFETGKGHGMLLFNENEKKFAIINFKNICAIEVEKTLIFMDEYEKKWKSVASINNRL
ncbi:hypothetical protein Metok_1348 [Methanothermococcus okinawensis IH1]|uniref:Uncharacterized protein n=1 Tax=Methanothermococcus okinawensis (strain DSM 14208 / JCM 11175 / IH1) TaxID=647113 RepID=F8AJV9_METOI|nr:hypothetical protein Metok_1348 [Methanothermococcus okinawensis IH1]